MLSWTFTIDWAWTWRSRTTIISYVDLASWTWAEFWAVKRWICIAGLGHLLGLETHDVGGYIEGRYPPRSELPGLKSLRTARWSDVYTQHQSKSLCASRCDQSSWLIVYLETPWMAGKLTWSCQVLRFAAHCCFSESGLFYNLKWWPQTEHDIFWLNLPSLLASTCVLCPSIYPTEFEDSNGFAWCLQDSWTGHGHHCWAW